MNFYIKTLPHPHHGVCLGAQYVFEEADVCEGYVSEVHRVARFVVLSETIASIVSAIAPSSSRRRTVRWRVQQLVTS